MGLGGFFGQLGAQVADNAYYGLQQQDQQATIDIKKAEAATMQMSALQKKQQMDTSAAISQMFQSQNQLSGKEVTDPLQQAGMYDKAAGIAASRGDFSTASEMSQLANGQRKAAGEQAKAKSQQQHQAYEDLATSASDYATNPTQGNLQKLVDNTKAAGKNPMDIPPPGTPQFTTWLNQQKQAGMDSKQRAELAEKTVEFQQRSEDRRAEFGMRMQEQRENRAMRAQIAAGMAEDRKARLQMERERTDIMKEKAAQGPRQSVQALRDTTAVAGASAEAARNIKQLQQFSAGTTSSPFINLTDHTILDSLAKSGSNALLPDEVQMVQTAGAGLALQVGRIETLGGGRGVNESQIKQLERQLVPAAGDTQAEVAYKMATAGELVSTRMKNQPAPNDPKLRSEWDGNLNYLDSMVKPEEILKAIKDPAIRKKINSFNGSYNNLLNSIDSQRQTYERSQSTGTAGEPPLPGGLGDPGVVNKPPLPPAASGGGLPAGWSVKVH